MIRNMIEGLDFWRASSKTGIATGWSTGENDILRVMDELKTTTEKIISGSHIENDVIPGHFKETVIKGITETIMDAISMVLRM